SCNSGRFADRRFPDPCRAGRAPERQPPLGAQRALRAGPSGPALSFQSYRSSFCMLPRTCSVEVAADDMALAMALRPLSMAVAAPDAICMVAEISDVADDC